MNEHRKALLMNVIRIALDSLRKIGVGYIDAEYTDEIHYMIDGEVFVVEVFVAEAKDGGT